MQAHSKRLNVAIYMPRCLHKV